jgi:hypothetical protein
MSGSTFALEMRLHEVLDSLDTCEESIRAMSQEGPPLPSSSHTDPFAGSSSASSSSVADRKLDEIILRIQALSRVLYRMQKENETRGGKGETSSAQGLLGTEAARAGSRRATKEFKAGGNDAESIEVVLSVDFEVPVLDQTGGPAATGEVLSAIPSGELSQESSSAAAKPTPTHAQADGVVGIVMGGLKETTGSQLARSTEDSSRLSSPRHLSAYSRNSTATNSMGESVWFSPSAPDLTSKSTMTHATIFACSAQQTEEEVQFTGTPGYLRNLNEDCELYIAALERRWSPEERQKLRFSTVV